MSKKIVLSEAAYYDIDSMFAYISQDRPATPPVAAPTEDENEAVVERT